MIGETEMFTAILITVIIPAAAVALLTITDKR